MKRILFIRAVIEAPANYDPMLTLSDAALWAECQLTHGQVYTDVTVYDSAEALVLDEREGVHAK